jgi:hypothetical protein
MVINIRSAQLRLVPGHWRRVMTLGMWKDLAQLVSVLVGAFAGFFAFRTYHRNARLERARWASNLYAKFYEGESSLKRVRDQLDCFTPDEGVNALVKSETAEFTDYLNFFELMAYLRKSKQLENEDIEALFGYYLDCMSKHRTVVEYIRDKGKGYESLRELLSGRTPSTR